MKKVLIIDDDWDTLELLCLIISSFDYEVTRSSNVLNIQEIEQLKSDLILLDHWVKGRLGGDLCKELKENVTTQNIPVILISAITGIEKIAEYDKADGYLQKPFDIEEVQVILETYLH